MGVFALVFPTYFTTIVVLRSVFSAEFDPRTVKAYEPAVVGLPVIAAVEAFRLSPGGRLPLTTEKLGAGEPTTFGLTLTFLLRWALILTA